MSYQERVLLPDGAMLELLLEPGPRYRLRRGRPGDWRVCFHNLGGKGHRRAIGGRESAYEFRSVEQLRYDFERDAEANP